MKGPRRGPFFTEQTSMGKRISKVVTRTGDDGTTGLATGRRVPKDHPRMQAIGDIDELNACIGLLRAQPLPKGVDAVLERIQHELFDLGGELSMDDRALLARDRVTALELQIEDWNAALPPLENFVLPAGGMAVASAHLARAVCRRAERSLVRLSHEEVVFDTSLRYLNRLSDLLFVLARLIAREAELREEVWKQLDPWDSPDDDD